MQFNNINLLNRKSKYYTQLPFYANQTKSKEVKQ